jgi:plasmid maintenance system killer protein
MLEIAFADELLREFCTKKLAAESEFGVVVARQLRSRIADLRAADNVAEVVTGNARAHDRDQYIVDICKKWHLLFKANHSSNPLGDHHRIDWKRVTRIRITHIGQYDDC